MAKLAGTESRMIPSSTRKQTAQRTGKHGKNISLVDN
jgi:hypothetical protein